MWQLMGFSRARAPQISRNARKATNIDLTIQGSSLLSISANQKTNDSYDQ